MLGGWWEALLDLVFPPACPVCRQAVDKHGALCRKCLAAVLLPRRLNVAVRRLAALDGCWVLCEYTAGIRLMIHNVKFHQADQLAVHFGTLLAERLEETAYRDVDAVVPVPLHASRLAERGYNQTELIFRKWANDHGLIWLEALDRVRATSPQWELEPAGRRKNVKGAFEVTRPDRISGKNILLVDDIVTTGATLHECAKMLKRSGAVTVTGLALAGVNR